MDPITFQLDAIEKYTHYGLGRLKKKEVSLGDIDPDKYIDYTIMSTQVEANLKLILDTLPKIRELSSKIVEAM